jgi:hypothetical protein
VFAPTESHVEALHALYNANPHLLSDLVQQAPIRALLQGPEPVEAPAAPSQASPVGSRGSKGSKASAHSAAPSTGGTNLHLSMVASGDEDDVKPPTVPRTALSADPVGSLSVPLGSVGLVKKAPASDSSHSSSSSVSSYYSDGQVVQAFAAFGPVQAQLPGTVESEDPDFSAEPWVHSDITLRQSVATLAAQLDHLAKITLVAIKHRATAMSELRSSVDSIRLSLMALSTDVNGLWDREDTYDEFGSVWDGVMHLSALITELEGNCLAATFAAQQAFSRAAAADSGLSTNMMEIAYWALKLLLVA